MMPDVQPGTVEPPPDGFHFDVDESVYRSWRACNWSWLKVGASPNTMSHMEWDAGHQDDDAETTAAKKFGRLWHRCLLEPSRARESYVVQPMTYPVAVKAKDAPGSVRLAETGLSYIYSYGRGEDRKSLDVATWWDEEDNEWCLAYMADTECLIAVDTKWSNNSTWCKRWIAEKEAEGKEVISAKDMQAASDMCAVVHKMPDFARLIDGAIFEVSMVWTDPHTGLRCKARLDVWQPETGQIADAKKVGRSAAWDRFERDLWFYKYHCQMAMYRDGANILLAKEGRAPTPAGFFRFIVVEDWGGHKGAIYKMIDDPRAPTHPLFRDGRETYRGLLLGVKNANEDDYWPPHNPTGPGGTTEEAEPVPSDWLLGKLGEGSQI